MPERLKMYFSDKYTIFCQSKHFILTKYLKMYLTYISKFTWVFQNSFEKNVVFIEKTTASLDVILFSNQS